MEENKLEDRYQREIQRNLSTESLNIIKEAKQQASEQRNKQQYDLPASKVTYKILFTVLGDVTFQPNNQKHSVLTEEEKQFAPRVADELEQCLNANISNVNFQVDFKIIDEKINLESSADNSLEFVEYIENHYQYGQYDAIVNTYGGTRGGGGATSTNYTKINGASFMRVGLSLNEKYTPVYSTIVTMHELCHAMSFMPVSVIKGNVHGASSYGYTNDARVEWNHFYIDYLNGRVKDTVEANPKSNGEFLGIFPKMWQITPRFLNSPSELKINYVDQNGQYIKDTGFFFGPSGDSYKLEPVNIAGYKYDSIKGDKSEGVLEKDRIKEVTYVYKQSIETKGSIKVVVKDKSGHLIPGVKVSWQDLSNNYVGSIRTTEKDGSFTQSNMSLGRSYKYTVTSVPAGYTMPTSATTVTPTGKNEDIFVVNLQIKEAIGNMKIIAKDKSGRVIPGVKVSWQDLSNNYVGSIRTTEKDGAFIQSNMSLARSYKYTVTSVPAGYTLPTSATTVTPNGKEGDTFVVNLQIK